MLPAASVTGSERNTYDVGDCELPPVRWLRNHSYPLLVSCRPFRFQYAVVFPVNCLLFRSSGSFASKYGALYSTVWLMSKNGESRMLLPSGPVWLKVKPRCEYCASASRLFFNTPLYFA